MTKKENQITIKMETDLFNELQLLVKTYEEKNGIEVKRTAILESALREGFKVLRERLK